MKDSPNLENRVMCTFKNDPDENSALLDVDPWIRGAIDGNGTNGTIQDYVKESTCRLSFDTSFQFFLFLDKVVFCHKCRKDLHMSRGEISRGTIR